MGSDALVQQILACVLTSVRVAVRFGSVVDPLGNAQEQGERQDKSTMQDRQILHNTRMSYPQVECLQHLRFLMVGVTHEPTYPKVDS